MNIPLSKVLIKVFKFQSVIAAYQLPCYDKGTLHSRVRFVLFRLQLQYSKTCDGLSVSKKQNGF